MLRFLILVIGLIIACLLVFGIIYVVYLACKYWKVTLIVLGSLWLLGMIKSCVINYQPELPNSTFLPNNKSFM